MNEIVPGIMGKPNRSRSTMIGKENKVGLVLDF
jgi:hypothetical protein